MKWIQILVVLLLISSVAVSANGGSFVIKKDKTIGSLSSQINGAGFGSYLVLKPNKSTTFSYLSATKGQIESLTVTSNTKQKGSVHLKLGKPTEGVLGFEILSTLKEAKYELIVRVPHGVGINGATKLESKNNKWDRYKLELKETGLFIVK
ncbi:MAG: hypothetical protein AABY22_25765 [Nanoarchaeota archaeon]